MNLMNLIKQSNRQPNRSANERGFTLVEVAVASLITMSGLVFLATLFTLAISQNRHVKQSSTATTLAQAKIEELNSKGINQVDDDEEDEDGEDIEVDTALAIGGNLTEAGKVTGYWDEVYVDDKEDNVYVGNIPSGQMANYKRYWKIEADPELNHTRIISVRVVAVFAAKGKKLEETTLTSVRSW